MNDLKDDSVFVLKLTMILGGVFMFCYSKTGTYLWVMIGAIGSSYLMHSIKHADFINQLIFSIIFISILFELAYSIIFRNNKSTFLGFKKEFDDAREELKRRKDKKNVSQFKENDTFKN
jgi:hypothetical protein